MYKPQNLKTSLRNSVYHTQEGESIEMSQLTEEEFDNVMYLIQTGRMKVPFKSKGKTMSEYLNSPFYRIAMDIDLQIKKNIHGR